MEGIDSMLYDIVCCKWLFAGVFLYGPPERFPPLWGMIGESREDLLLNTTMHHSVARPDKFSDHMVCVFGRKIGVPTESSF